MSVSPVSLLVRALCHWPSLSPFLHPSPLPQPPGEQRYCWCITTQDNLFKWQIRRVTRFVSDTVCSVCYQSNKANLPAPFLLLPLSPSPHPHTKPVSAAISSPVQWERKRLVSRAVTRSQAGATKASALIESQGREAARFGKALIDSLIGAEGPQKYALQSRPINQTIKPSLCSWLWSI